MKKVLSVILCIAFIFCAAACGNAETSSDLQYTNYEIGSYTMSLPKTYEFNDLTEVKAEADCIAMLTDSKGELPDLWIYEDKTTASTIKEYIFDSDEYWNFDELAVYKKDSSVLAKTAFYEDWYGQNLINVGYYRMEASGNVLWFDFAYDASIDSATMYPFITEIAETLGF